MAGTSLTTVRTKVRWPGALLLCAAAASLVRCDSFSEAGSADGIPPDPFSPPFGRAGFPNTGGFVATGGRSTGGVSSGGTRTFGGTSGTGVGGAAGSAAARRDGGPSAISTDAGPPAPPPVDGGRRCAIAEVMSFGIRGGSPPVSTTFVLVPSATVVGISTTGGLDGCAVELPACDDGNATSVANVATLLAGPAITAAFEGGVELYGEDRRSAGEYVYSLTRFSDGETFFVGSPCGDASDCVDAPRGVSALPELFEAVAAEYPGWAATTCAPSGRPDGGFDGGTDDAGALSTLPYVVPVECTEGCTCPRLLQCDLSCGATACDTECAPGSQCHVGCAGGDCAMECLAADCSISCENAGECVSYCGAAACAMECPGGNCLQYCEVGSTCNVDCAGGGCLVDCEEASTCNVRCSGGGCDVECQNGSTCTVDCPTGDCTVACDLDATCL